MLQPAGSANANVPDGASADQCAEFFLACDGKPLQDNDSLGSSGIRPGAKIQLEVGHLNCQERSSCSLEWPIFFPCALHVLPVGSHLSK